MTTSSSISVEMIAREAGVSPDQCRLISTAVLRALHRVAIIEDSVLVAMLDAAYSELGPEACYHVGGLLELSRLDSDDGVAWPGILESIDPNLVKYRALVEAWTESASEDGQASNDSGATEADPATGLLSLCDHLSVVVSRADVEACNIGSTLSTLQRLLETPETARDFMELVEIGFHGYDHTREELWEIPEVRNFVHRLDEQFPYWFYFLSKQGLGLHCIVKCHLLPFLTPAAQAREHPQKLAWLMEHRWFPAMNAACEFAGLSMHANQALTERGTDYLVKGRSQLPPAEAEEV